MACKGPLDLSSEYTVLLGWIERNNEKVLVAVKKKAQQNRLIVLADITRRVHERLR